MEDRIQSVVKLGLVNKEIQAKHKGFSEWNLVLNSRNHQTILQILIDGRDPNAVDNAGFVMPTLVYLSREKRPQHHHNFKAGALNALIRVSSEISNGPIILTLDCDMYSNDAQTVRDTLCFFMDEDKGEEIGFVQYPQRFMNNTKNDFYANSFRVITKLELSGMDGYGGPMYIGTGCFFRRESLSGKKYIKGHKTDWNKRAQRDGSETVDELEDRAKMGLKYGCLVEDVTTGLAIHSRGWKKTSAYLFGTIDCALNLLGITKSAFPITVKIADDELSKRYEQEIMEFGTTSPMFTILATLAMINILCLGGAIKRLVMDDGVRVESFVLQFAQCGLWVLINLPIYEGLFLRKDEGRMPPSLAFTSTALAVLASVLPMH
ncbi:cellulose synthase-like protein E6 isoform X2 [Cinnamomum micranthum f. kanehirae]|uniref:Cellulose synthase-like protein E6 isoform X2 n=1 Tax=Cinnamomum micranthum f. kanehirae TaxID=337451 RepID=A0A3S3MYL5_9MAGN|nr:cellulose synthase-like protein E6 isoform X2 [Cinnamomum micranthum f. kanehirae]